jgi:peptide-methionine (S)-S-oxide reductase
MKVAGFAMGCFWGPEKLLWTLDGVVITAVGYAGGFTPNPTYDEVLTGLTGHAETVLVVYDPTLVSFVNLVKVFFESHDPTTPMRQGSEVGSHYRSMIFAPTLAERAIAEEIRSSFQRRLLLEGFGPIVTEVVLLKEFYFAERYHQQYLARHAVLKSRLSPTGISCAVHDRGDTASS